MDSWGLQFGSFGGLIRFYYSISYNSNNYIILNKEIYKRKELENWTNWTGRLINPQPVGRHSFLQAGEYPAPPLADFQRTG